MSALFKLFTPQTTGSRPDRAHSSENARPPSAHAAPDGGPLDHDAPSIAEGTARSNIVVTSSTPCSEPDACLSTQPSEVSASDNLKSLAAVMKRQPYAVDVVVGAGAVVDIASAMASTGELLSLGASELANRANPRVLRSA